MHLQLANISELYAGVVGDLATDTERDILIVADLLRAELTARGHATRSTLARRVQQSVAPAIVLERDIVLGVCAELERAGDFNVAPGGVLFATPLRSIALSAVDFRVVSSAPTAWLRASLGGIWALDGVLRTCRIDSGTGAEWRVRVSAHGGIVITPETWAGLNTSPKADASWLSSLDARFDFAAKPGFRGERDQQLSWKAFTLGDNGGRWAPAADDAKARLWRAWNEYGYWIFAWTSGGDPTTTSSLALTDDEAARTLFAIARNANVPVVVDVQEHSDHVALAVPHWLPRAEYRFLSVSARKVVRNGSQTVWQVPAERSETTVATLIDRLGISARRPPAP
jgi:hypothetical protein